MTIPGRQSQDANTVGRHGDFDTVVGPEQSHEPLHLEFKCSQAARPARAYRVAYPDGPCDRIVFPIADGQRPPHAQFRALRRDFGEKQRGADRGVEINNPGRGRGGGSNVSQQRQPRFQQFGKPFGDHDQSAAQILLGADRKGFFVGVVSFGLIDADALPLVFKEPFFADSNLSSVGVAVVEPIDVVPWQILLDMHDCAGLADLFRTAPDTSDVLACTLGIDQSKVAGIGLPAATGDVTVRPQYLPNMRHGHRVRHRAIDLGFAKPDRIELIHRPQPIQFEVAGPPFLEPGEYFLEAIFGLRGGGIDDVAIIYGGVVYDRIPSPSS